MSDKIKQLAPQIWTEIQKANRVLLHCHPSSDADSVGGVLASKFALEGLGKKVTAIWGDSPPPQFLKSLPGFESIIAKNWTQIDPSEFDLFIIQDSSSPRMISGLGEVIFPDQLSTVIIDHHSTNKEYAKISLVETSYPSVCQILFDLFQEWKIKLTPDISINLFMGMYTDTGGFKYPLTTADTFRIAAKLAETGIDFPKIVFEMENSQDPKSIEYMGLFFSSIKHHFSGKVAICSVTYKQLLDGGIPVDINIPELSNIIKSAVGNDISVSLTEDQPNVVNVSMRRRDEKYDLAKIVVATGSGGGHPVAAGATLKMSMPKAIDFILETIRKVYPELGQP